jgi:excisionase family DNA binding protein
MNGNDGAVRTMKIRLTPKDVAQRLHIGSRTVYTMLEDGILPGIRIGQRWLITRIAFEQWERTCGLRSAPDVPLSTGLTAKPEVTVD